MDMTILVKYLIVKNYFNQIKTYIKKNRDVYTFDGLKNNIDKAIDKVNPKIIRIIFNMLTEYKMILLTNETLQLVSGN